MPQYAAGLLVRLGIMEGNAVAAVAVAVGSVACYGLCEAGGCLCAVLCKWCGRAFGSPHPLPRNVGRLRPFRKGRGLECDICDSVLTLYYKAEIRKELHKKYTKDEGNAGQILGGLGHVGKSAQG